MVAPNPFRHSTTVHYSIDNTARVSICIYDITGTLKNTLVDNIVSKGLYTVIWDGVNSNNDPLSAGVYFIELKADSYVTSYKILLTE